MDNAEQPITEINTLADFMGWVAQVRPKDTTQDKAVCFYRGHSDISWQLLPGAYRLDQEGRSFRSDESQLYHEMLRRDPAAFAEDKTAFERLTRMQHYGLPTRLLDITENPLVALFFACSTSFSIDGQVMAFTWADRRPIIHQHDLPLASMAGVEKALDLSLLHKCILDSYYKYLSREKAAAFTSPSGCQEFDDNFHSFLDRIEQAYAVAIELCSDPLSGFRFFETLEKLVCQFNDAWIERFKQIVDGSTNVGNLNAQVFLHKMSIQFTKWEKKCIASLCDQMGIPDQSSRQSLAAFLHQLTYFYFVAPSMNNERIRRQQGGFVLFPPISSSTWALGNFRQPELITIKADAKQSLLQELTNIGITHSHLFPELEEQAKHIRSIYPPSPDKFRPPLPQVGLE